MRPAALKKIVLSSEGLCALPKRMFGGVWKWAGRFRTRDLSLGCAWWDIESRVMNLCQDVRMQVQNEAMAWDEIGVGFHHRLVIIHPFVNGNGRHSREAASLLMRACGQPEFTWGAGYDLVFMSETRDRYISALKQADAHDIRALIEFARS